MGKASTKQSPLIPKTAVPRSMRDILEWGLYPMGTWESLFQDTIQKGPPTPLRTQGHRDVSLPIAELECTNTDPDVMSVGLVPSSVLFLDLEGDVVVARSCCPTWEAVVDANQLPLEWAPVVIEQWATIERMCGILDNLSTDIPQVVDKLNFRFRLALWDQAGAFALCVKNLVSSASNPVHFCS